MLQSKLFTKTKKESPTDEISKNAELLIRASFIYKEMAGVYSILPLGLRVINKITNIIREEMNKVGGQEISMTALQDKACWEKTDRWDDKNVDNWFKTKLKNKTEVGLGFTHGIWQCLSRNRSAARHPTSRRSGRRAAPCSG